VGGQQHRRPSRAPGQPQQAHDFQPARQIQKRRRFVQQQPRFLRQRAGNHDLCSRMSCRSVANGRQFAHSAVFGVRASIIAPTTSASFSTTISQFP
jgi:hypothetical protein